MSINDFETNFIAQIDCIFRLQMCLINIEILKHMEHNCIKPRKYKVTKNYIEGKELKTEEGKIRKST
jgi:hypothetical protein